jgi:hypothetical protein
MPPAIVLDEYAREDFMVQALATAWFATGITLVENALPERGLGFAHPTSDAGRGFPQDRMSAA